MSIVQKILQANKKYADNFGSKAQMSVLPQKKVAILTCMDTRVDPLMLTGLQQGDAHIIRNAGGRASADAIRSLIISHQLLGTQIFLVIHHTECGMLSFNIEVMRKRLEKNLASHGDVLNSQDHEKNLFDLIQKYHIDWLEIEDQEKCMIADVTRITKHPLVSQDIPVYGYFYDVKTGLLHELAAATQAGKPRNWKVLE